MQKILDRIDQQLKHRQQAGNLRKLPGALPQIDFASNDYLGLARSPQLAEKILQASQQYPNAQHGATGSRLITGNTPLAEEVEHELVAYVRAEACLLYTSGYAANQGLLSALLQRGDTVLYDELSHACIKDGCRLSPANRFSFRHNDVAHLRQKLSKATGAVFVVVESVYSMDGDEAPLENMAKLCREWGAGLIVDEAHSTAIWGPDGAGSCVAQGVADDVLARVHTFGKAMGVHGACVAGRDQLIHYLLNYSRTFIYTTGLPPHSLLSIREAMRFRQQHPEVVQALFKNIGYFHLLLQQQGIQHRVLPSRSAIQAVLVPGNTQVRACAAALQAQGFAVWPILAPTVPEGEERLRICLHSYNTEAEIQALVEALTKQIA